MSTKDINHSNKTLLQKQSDVKQSWFVLDATGKTLGRFCSEITKILRGKHKATFTPSLESGDGVIVINAGKIKVTGNKEVQKEYFYYTGSMGGLRKVPYQTMKARNPEYLIEHAVEGMMPKTRLSKQQLKKRLRVFADDQHDMEAQKPIYATI